MNTRLLNTLLIFFITLIVLNFVLPKPNQTPNTTNEITIRALKESYVTPDIPVLEVQNTTTESISIDVCKNLSIQKDYTPLTGLPAEFCKTLIIASGGKEKIDLGPLYRLFQVPGKYDFLLVKDAKTT